MKIAFWSNVREWSSVSPNLAAISVAIAIRYPYSIITLENHLCNHGLGKAYNDRTRAALLADAGTNYYDGFGMEGLLRKIYRREYHIGTLQSHLKEIIKDRLYYIPQSRVILNDLFDYEFEHCINPLFYLLDNNADVCFIDTACNSLSTKNILEESDLIVINLCQKASIIEDFFQRYSSLIPKAVFLINDYDPHHILNYKQISKQYGVPSENVIGMPSSERYRDAYLGGYVHQFISRNLHCQKEDPDYMFMQTVKKAAVTIIRKVEINTKQKEIHSCGS